MDIDSYNSLKNQIDEAQNTITYIYTKYVGDPYMTAKVHNYITNQLPVILENIRETHEQNQTRIEELTNDQDAFIQSFLNNNQYFYISSTEKFFCYDGTHYHCISEDDLLYTVLSSISRDRERNLMPWKKSTKRNVMKRIKENNLLKSIPESETIQNVIDSLCPAIFNTRAETKYFLTILGDNIFRKNNNIIHFIHVNSKHFIRELNNMCQIVIGSNLSQTMKHKYHEHNYSDCRIVRINETIKSEYIWKPIVNQFVLDIICVACHYSNRYGSSDDYVMKSSNDNVLFQTAFYLKELEPIDLVNSFIQEYLELSQPGRPNNTICIDGQLSHMRTPYISWKNIQYLWKQFLDSKNIPNVLFLQNLKTLLISNLKDYYVEEHDAFVGVCSKYLPEIQKFLQFWNETLIEDDSEMDFEIDEIIILLRNWCISKNEPICNLNDKQILDLISHFFPNVEIERDKFISRIKCSLWDKELDIQLALENMKHSLQNNSMMPISRTLSPSSSQNISIYDAYYFYCKYHSSLNHNNTVSNQIVSKSYFEKYIFENLSNYVVDSKFLSVEWFKL